MLNDGKDYLSEAWWLATFPGLTITIVVVTVNMSGDALQNIYNPKGGR